MGCPDKAGQQQHGTRQIKGGAARLEGEKITDPNQEFASAAELEGKVLQLGKKTFRRLVG